MSNEKKKIHFSNKIYPLFSGLSGDLLFWIAINMLFLTNVKHLSVVEINSLTSLSVIVVIFTQSLIFKIIKKIGNVNSVRLGTILLLIAALLLTFSNTYLFILLGNILYEIAFLFKNMDTVILRKNLKYENKVDDYIRIQSKSTTVYSFVTMLIALVAGFLYNINPYLPMILCIIFCINNVILSNFIYEVKDNQQNKIEIKKFKFTKIIILILIIFALLYAVIDMGQNNTILFMQYNMSDFLTQNKVAIYITIIIAISRFIRVVANYLFTRVKKINDKLLYEIGLFVVLSYLLILLGNFIGHGMIGVSIIALGFFIFLAVRDPFENYMRNLMLDNCDTVYHEKAIIYLSLFREIGKFAISTLITLLLLKLEMPYIMLFLLIMAVLNIFIIRKIYNLVNSK